MGMFDWFCKSDIDFSAVGLDRGELPRYFCTPTNLCVFAHLGCDGVHFGMINDLQNADISEVYVVSPLSGGEYVNILSHSFVDFLDMLLVIQNANYFEYAVTLTEEKFIAICQNHVPYEQALYILKLIEEKFETSFIDRKFSSASQIYSAINNITPKSKLSYSQEFYSATTGLPFCE